MCIQRGGASHTWCRVLWISVCLCYKTRSRRPVNSLRCSGTERTCVILLMSMEDIASCLRLKAMQQIRWSLYDSPPSIGPTLVLQVMLTGNRNVQLSIRLDPSRPDLWCITPPSLQHFSPSLAKWAAVPGDRDPWCTPFWLPLVPRVIHLVTGPSRELWPTVANCSSSAACTVCMFAADCNCLTNANGSTRFGKLFECVTVLLSGTGNAASYWKRDGRYSVWLYLRPVLDLYICYVSV